VTAVGLWRGWRARSDSAWDRSLIQEKKDLTTIVFGTRFEPTQKSNGGSRVALMDTQSKTCPTHSCSFAVNHWGNATYVPAQTPCRTLLI
jgi:hypothetical protein